MADDHQVQECPVRQNERRDSPRCSCCNEIGYIARNCEYENNNEQTNNSTAERVIENEENNPQSISCTHESGKNTHIAADNEQKQQIRHGVVSAEKGATRVRHPIYPLQSTQNLPRKTVICTVSKPGPTYTNKETNGLFAAQHRETQ